MKNELNDCNLVAISEEEMVTITGGIFVSGTDMGGYGPPRVYLSSVKKP